jgi:hypothetical protein
MLQCSEYHLQNIGELVFGGEFGTQGRNRNPGNLSQMALEAQGEDVPLLRGLRDGFPFAWENTDTFQAVWEGFLAAYYDEDIIRRMPEAHRGNPIKRVNFIMEHKYHLRR